MMVSVVIPAYNAEAFIEEAVHSALGQTYTNVEVIVVDDGSTDRTLQVLAGIADERLHVISQPNSGVGRARNEGIRVARGECIALLDADDVWSAEKIRRQMAALKEHPEWAVVGSFMHHISTDGRPIGVSGHHIGEVEAREVREALLMPFPISSMVVRRQVLDRVGLFDEHLSAVVPGMVEDLDLLARIAAAGEVGSVEEVLGGYRMHSGSGSARFFRSQRRGGRYLAARYAAAAKGQHLTYEEFEAGQRWSFGQWRADTAAYCYRSAGINFADGSTLRAVCWGVPAFILSPHRTLRRLALQRGRLGRVTA